MNCDGVRGLLSAYMDGELTAGELLRVEQHLRRCHWCADEVDALRQTIALVAALDEVEVPASFHAQLHERLVAVGPPVQAVRDLATQRAKRPDFRRWAIPAAAAAALVIGVTGLNRLAPLSSLLQPPAESVSHGNPGGTPTVMLPGTTKEPNPPTDTGEKPPTEAPSVTPEPPAEVGGGGGGKTEQPTNPVQPPPTEPVVNPVVTNPGGPAPLGPTDKGSGIYTVTYLDNVTEPTQLPSQRQSKAAIQAVVSDPVAAATELESLPATVNKNVNAGMIQVQLTVSAKAFPDTVANIEKQLGVKATVEGVELSSQLDDLYQRIAGLENERVALVAQLDKESNPEAIDAAKLALENLNEEASQHKEAFQRLIEQVETGVITVTLKPDTAR